MFKITANMAGYPIEVTWAGGTLTGDPLACALLRYTAPHVAVGLGGGPLLEGDAILASDVGTYLLAYGHCGFM